MRLVVVLRFLIGENEIKSDLVSLIDNGPMAGGHFAGMEMQHAGNRPQILLHTSQKLIGRLGIGRVSPEYDNVREHNFYFCESQWPNGSGGMGVVSG